MFSCDNSNTTYILKELTINEEDEQHYVSGAVDLLRDVTVTDVSSFLLLLFFALLLALEKTRRVISQLEYSQKKDLGVGYLMVEKGILIF